MEADRWRQVDELFHQASELAPEKRSAFVAERCAGDDDLRQEVESLLDSDSRAPAFLETPAIEAVADTFANDPSAIGPGARVGAYRVENLIARGGMGAVYLARRDDDQFTKSVALKIVKRGMDTDEILRRFRNERQALADLEHPNIARLLDGGVTDDGRPYLVMEYVDGQPLTTHCRAQGLSLDERIGLFLKVCAAVQSAHQRLIVHRDLKPGNILVGEGGEPKLLDFGIARLLESDSGDQATGDVTVETSRLYTPDYASPEQVRGEFVGIPGDVYSLGVILYELLTDEKPYKVSSTDRDEIRRQLADLHAERPSARAADTRTQRRLRGDLDNIILTAMRVEPERRYDSVAHLADDIERSLQGRPVHARPDTLRYRTSKFVRRNKTGVAAAAIVVLALLAGAAGIALQARETTRQRDIAERRFDDVRELANAVMFDIHDEIRDLPGSTAARRVLVERSLEYLDNLAKESAGDLSLQRELATAYQRVGDLQGNPWLPNIGDTEAAFGSYLRALELFENTASRSDDELDQRGLYIAYVKLGNIYAATGAFEESRSMYDKALVFAEDRAQQDPTDPVRRSDLAIAFEKVGDSLHDRSQPEEALESYRQALTTRLESPTIGSDVNEQYGACVVRNKLGNALGHPAYANVGDVNGALAEYQQALEVFLTLMEQAPTDGRFPRAASIMYTNIGEMLRAKEDLDRALEIQYEALELAQRIAAQDPSNALARRDEAVIYLRIGELLVDLDRAASAIEALETSLAIRIDLAEADPSNALARESLELGWRSLGEAHAAQAEDDELSLANRLASCAESIRCLEEALGILIDMRDAGQLRPSQEGLVDQVTQQIADERVRLRDLQSSIPESDQRASQNRGGSRA